MRHFPYKTKAKQPRPQLRPIQRRMPKQWWRCPHPKPRHSCGGRACSREACPVLRYGGGGIQRGGAGGRKNPFPLGGKVRACPVLDTGMGELQGRGAGASSQTEIASQRGKSHQGGTPEHPTSTPLRQPSWLPAPAALLLPRRLVGTRPQRRQPVPQPVYRRQRRQHRNHRHRYRQEPRHQPNRQRHNPLRPRHQPNRPR